MANESYAVAVEAMQRGMMLREQGTLPNMTRQMVNEIWESDKKVQKLSADWFNAVQTGDNVKAARARRELNAIKQRILSKYQIIL